mmetsp:Transcript_13537/g.44113  ORF Transcript_13537/g.44113 Transcript_13537/m.44113 type:complete len:89 (-) Transcript_13537:91-357(-)
MRGQREKQQQQQRTQCNLTPLSIGCPFIRLFVCLERTISRWEKQYLDTIPLPSDCRRRLLSAAVERGHDVVRAHFSFFLVSVLPARGG